MTYTKMEVVVLSVANDCKEDNEMYNSWVLLVTRVFIFELDAWETYGLAMDSFQSIVLDISPSALLALSLELVREVILHRA